VTTRHFGADDDHFAAGIATENESGRRNGVLAAIRQAHQASGTGRAGGAGGRLAARYGQGEGRHHLGASRAGLVDHPELVSAQRDLVAMQQRGRLRPEPHPVHPYFRRRRGDPNGRLAGSEELHNRMTCQDIRPLEEDPGTRSRTEHELPRRDGVSPAADLNLDHAGC